MSSVAKATPDDVDKILQIIMNEVTKIEKMKKPTTGTPKWTKLYKISACFKKEKKWKQNVGEDKYSSIIHNKIEESSNS